MLLFLSSSTQIFHIREVCLIVFVKSGPWPVSPISLSLVMCRVTSLSCVIPACSAPWFLLAELHNKCLLSPQRGAGWITWLESAYPVHYSLQLQLLLPAKFRDSCLLRSVSIACWVAWFLPAQLHDIKAASALFSHITHSGEATTMWRGTEASCQQPAPWKCSILEVGPPAPSLQMTTVLADILTATSKETQSKLAPEFLSRRNRKG